ncbi:HNH endonuclease [Nocardia salmonicida]|uniref:HNH endonuclease n=1 Tax=Nocardia salmonicida TaxID=53431 RepID=UPI0037921B4E
MKRIRIVGVVVTAALVALVILAVYRWRGPVAAVTSSPVRPVTVPESAPRLAVELVPKTRWRINLRTALPDREWRRLRGIVCEAAGYRCEICGGVGRRAPDCNEVWEYDDERLIQRLVRLEALCSPCHAAKHIGREIAQGRGEQAVNHLAAVNGWTPQQTALYLKEQFAQWDVRSTKQWTFDLAALAQYGPPLPPSNRRKRCDECRELYARDKLTAVAAKRWLCEGCHEKESTGPAADER